MTMRILASRWPVNIVSFLTDQPLCRHRKEEKDVSVYPGRLSSSLDFKKVTAQPQLVRPPPETNQLTDLEEQIPHSSNRTCANRSANSYRCCKSRCGPAFVKLMNRHPPTKPLRGIVDLGMEISTTGKTSPSFVQRIGESLERMFFHGGICS